MKYREVFYTKNSVVSSLTSLPKCCLNGWFAAKCLINFSCTPFNFHYIIHKNLFSFTIGWSSLLTFFFPLLIPFFIYLFLVLVPQFYLPFWCTLCSRAAGKQFYKQQLLHSSIVLGKVGFKLQHWYISSLRIWLFLWIGCKSLEIFLVLVTQHAEINAIIPK